MGRATRFELATFGTTNRRSNQLSYARHEKNCGGADQTRTDDPLHAMQVLYQLSYNPIKQNIFYISSCQMSNIFANLLVIQGELYGLSNFKTGR